MIYKVTHIILVPRINWNSKVYGQMAKIQSGNKYSWLISCPCCGEISGLEHNVIMHEGIPTIQPSIICGNPICLAHFYVTNGKIEAL